MVKASETSDSVRTDRRPLETFNKAVKKSRECG